MLKVEQNKIIKKQKLFDAAFDILLEQGVEKTTITQITRRAGLAKGTFYLYFADKNAIVQQLVQLYADRLLGDAWLKLCPAEGEWDGISLMSGIAGEVIDALARDKRLICFMRSNLSFALFSKITASPTGKEPTNILETILILLESGGIKMKQPRIALAMIIELIVGVCYQAILYQDPLPIEEIKPYIFTAIEGIVACM